MSLAHALRTALSYNAKQTSSHNLSGLLLRFPAAESDAAVDSEPMAAGQFRALTRGLKSLASRTCESE